MLRIEQIRLRLPAGYAYRATRIARLVGEQLGAETAGLQTGRVERLMVSVVAPHPQSTDSEIARLAVAQLRRSLRGNA